MVARNDFMAAANSSVYFAFYGSLRRGMQNYLAFANELEYLHSAWLRGYKMFALDEYPCVVKAEPDSKILVEIMRAKSSRCARQIHQLEVDAGYAFETISVARQEVVIYYFALPPNDRLVASGDWVTFFRESHPR